MSYTDCFHVDATMVANEFLEKYMPSANGDYVKVYLFLLKNRVSGIDVETIAEQLQLTEGDVRRAIRYWEEKGIISVGKPAESGKKGAAADIAAAENAAAADAVPAEGSAEAAGADKEAAGKLRSRYKKAEGLDALLRLSRDTEFGELMFIVQKYLSKVLSEQEQETFAYLYDGLGMPCDVLDYLVSYCVENDHTDLRYIEKKGLEWHSRGVRDLKAARRLTKEADQARKEKSEKKTRTSMKQGITREEDLDAQLLDMVIKRKMS